MADDAIRVPTAQARGLTHQQIRRTNYEEAVYSAPSYTDDPLFRPGAQLVHDDFAAADMTAEGSAAWSEGHRVDGFERLTLFGLHTAGVATTAIHVAVQVSMDNATWFDLHADEASNGVLVRKVYDLTTSVNAAVAWEIPTAGRFMRFKPWADGSDRAGSRFALYSRRIMNAS